VSASAAKLSNEVVAALLARTADLAEIAGANPFRVRAYRHAAETIAALPQQLSELIESREPLTSISGIGKDLAAGLQALFEVGQLPALQELEDRVPVGLLEVVKVAGVGPKRAAQLWAALEITNLDLLEAAAQQGRIAPLKGFGEKTQEKILAGVALLRRFAGRVRWDIAEARLEQLLRELGALPELERLEVAGSLRRKRADVGDVDVLVVARDVRAVMACVREHPDVAEVLASGETKTSVRLVGDLQVDVRVVPSEAFGSAWQYFTGSKGHNVALRQRALNQGMSLSEYGLVRLSDGVTVASSDEQSIYHALGLAFIPPELREARGEIERAALAGPTGDLEPLLKLSDIRGDLHSHSSWSDGADSVRAMRHAAQERGYAFWAITDHSQLLKMTGGLDEAKLARQWLELDEIDAESGVIEPVMLRGLEVDILKDGSLDLSDEWLERLDVVVASVHSHLDLPLVEQTERVVRALSHPQVNILGHPTGRLIGGRDGIALDLDAVFEAAAANRVAIECNASPQRLDLGDIELTRAVGKGCLISVNSDAHSCGGLGVMRFGIGTARRAALRPEQVINTWSLSELRTFLRKR
jgi:DNA polymerase (family 10)